VDNLKIIFSVKLRLLGMSHIKLCKFSVSANIAFTIFRINMLVGCFWKRYIGQAVGSEWNMMDLIGSRRVGCYPIGSENVVEENR
jgi:hypothetical protein